MTTTFLEQVEKKRGEEKRHRLAWDRFLEVGLPNKKSEVFRYVRLRSFYERELHQIEFESPKLPNGVIAIPLTEAWQTYRAYLEKQQALWLKKEKDPFALLNGAFANEGLFLYIPPNVKLEKPLYIKGSRIIAFIGKGADVKLSCEATFCDFSLEEGAKVEVQREINHLQSLRATVKKDARFKSVAFATKSPLARDDYHIQLIGEGADASLWGLGRLVDREEAHTHVLMEHIAPHTTSFQRFKGVISDRSRSTFEGKIYVEPQAQKTNAYQMVQHLALSPTAEAKSKPNLEIFADDVKASHGATIGKLDEESLFYLLTRGIEKPRAKTLLIEAFCKEVLHEAFA
ncbi:MAG: hypothetical protein S4CHLAM45_12030 [Chlamydiales bacterium]|nr:hypothetical protein [Chlamydiales bacterium]MCH9619692.1 hypothetical protein [Chlamydiales bacterium]MCH9623298.1 hypothetical protein [Chlamydiales bacterium]